jgi:hypothetical protein
MLRFVFTCLHSYTASTYTQIIYLWPGIVSYPLSVRRNSVVCCHVYDKLGRGAREKSCGTLTSRAYNIPWSSQGLSRHRTPQNSKGLSRGRPATDCSSTFALLRRHTCDVRHCGHPSCRIHRSHAAAPNANTSVHRIYITLILISPKA